MSSQTQELKAYGPAFKAWRGAPSVALTICLLVLWEVLVGTLAVPAYILPAPSSVAVQIYQDFATGLIFPHFALTLIEVIVGFLIAAIAGIALGTAVGLIPALDRAFYPILLAFQTVPKVALAPLLVIWFGYGIHSKAVMAALIAFFPILVNVIAGLKTTDARRLLLMSALNATPFQTYMKVRVPSMLPYLSAGFEVAIVLSLIGAIVGEFVGASVGLGSLIIQRQAVVDVAGVFSVLAYLSVMGLALSMSIKFFTDRMTFWARSQDIQSA